MAIPTTYAEVASKAIDDAEKVIKGRVSNLIAENDHMAHSLISTRLRIEQLAQATRVTRRLATDFDIGDDGLAASSCADFAAELADAADLIQQAAYIFERLDPEVTELFHLLGRVGE